MNTLLAIVALGVSVDALLLFTVFRKVTHMSASSDRLTAAVTKSNADVAALVTKVSDLEKSNAALQAQVAELIVTQGTPDAALDALSAQVETSNQAAEAALTPPAPAADPSAPPAS